MIKRRRWRADLGAAGRSMAPLERFLLLANLFSFLFSISIDARSLFRFRKSASHSATQFAETGKKALAAHHWRGLPPNRKHHARTTDYSLSTPIFQTSEHQRNE